MVCVEACPGESEIVILPEIQRSVRVCLGMVLMMELLNRQHIFNLVGHALVALFQSVPLYWKRFYNQVGTIISLVSF